MNTKPQLSQHKHLNTPAVFIRLTSFHFGSVQVRVGAVAVCATEAPAPVRNALSSAPRSRALRAARHSAMHPLLNLPTARTPAAHPNEHEYAALLKL